MKLFVKFDDRKESPEPEKVNAKRVVLLGTFAWGLVLVVLGAFYPALSNARLDWWLHTALVGVGLGFVGLTMIPKR